MFSFCLAHCKEREPNEQSASKNYIARGRCINASEQQSHVEPIGATITLQVNWVMEVLLW